MKKPFWELEKKELEDTFLSKSKSKKQVSKYNKNWKQYQVKGFSDSDLWSLDQTLAKIILPRLIEFKKTISNPNSVAGCPSIFVKGKSTKANIAKGCKLWYKELDKMIYAFEIISSEKEYITDDKTTKKVQEGLDSFAKYFRNLWW